VYSSRTSKRVWSDRHPCACLAKVDVEGSSPFSRSNPTQQETVLEHEEQLCARQRRLQAGVVHGGHHACRACPARPREEKGRRPPFRRPTPRFPRTGSPQVEGARGRSITHSSACFGVRVSQRRCDRPRCRGGCDPLQIEERRHLLGKALGLEVIALELDTPDTAGPKPQPPCPAGDTYGSRLPVSDSWRRSCGTPSAIGLRPAGHLQSHGPRHVQCSPRRTDRDLSRPIPSVVRSIGRDRFASRLAGAVPRVGGTARPSRAIRCALVGAP